MGGTVAELGTGRIQAYTWIFLWAMAIRCPVLLCEVSDSARNASSKRQIVEEMDRETKKNLMGELMMDGDRYLREKNYNLANASYESVFLLDPSNVEASNRIDRLKRHMVKEGRSETELVARIYDSEIDIRVREYLKQAKQLLEEEKWSQARFALQKLLLLNPLHEEAQKLYKSLEQRPRE